MAYRFNIISSVPLGSPHFLRSGQENCQNDPLSLLGVGFNRVESPKCVQLRHSLSTDVNKRRKTIVNRIYRRNSLPNQSDRLESTKYGGREQNGVVRQKPIFPMESEGRRSGQFSQSGSQRGGQWGNQPTAKGGGREEEAHSNVKRVNCVGCQPDGREFLG